MLVTTSTTEDLLDRINLDPNPNNWIILSEWIGTLDLKSGADAIVHWANAIYNRADELNYWLKPQPKDNIEPTYDLSIFNDIIINRIEWNLEDIVESFERFYPEDRQSVVQTEIDNTSKIVPDEKESDPLAVAHHENINLWIQEIVNLIRDRPRTLKELSQDIPIVQVWLSVLLSDSRINMTRKSGDFYDIDTILLEINIDSFSSCELN